MSDASQAVMRKTPSSTNSTTSGSAAKMQLRASELLTGSSTCWYMGSPSSRFRRQRCCGYVPGPRLDLHAEIGRGQASERRIDHLDGVRQRDRAAELGDRRGGLHEAARIG